jgi:hypothetical protein
VVDCQVEPEVQPDRTWMLGRHREPVPRDTDMWVVCKHLGRYGEIERALLIPYQHDNTMTSFTGHVSIIAERATQVSGRILAFNVFRPACAPDRASARSVLNRRTSP